MREEVSSGTISSFLLPYRVRACIFHFQWNPSNHVRITSCKRGAVRFYSRGLSVLVLAFIDSTQSWSKAETELYKQLLTTAPLSNHPQLVWMQSRLLEPPCLPPYSSLASSLHPRVESPASSRPQPGSGLRLSLHLTVWLSVTASRRSTDHYRYQALFPQQNDISAFDPLPELIFVHFWAFSPRNCSHSGQNSSTDKNTPLFSWWDGEMCELTTGHHRIRRLSHTCSIYEDSACCFLFFFIVVLCG